MRPNRRSRQSTDAAFIRKLIGRIRVLYRFYLTCPHWKKVRKSAIKIAENKCEECGTEGPNLEVHHLNYECLGKEDPWEDLLVLCPKCHRKIHGK